MLYVLKGFMVSWIKVRHARQNSFVYGGATQASFGSTHMSNVLELVGENKAKSSLDLA